MLVRDIVYQHHSPDQFHSHPPVYEIEKCLEIKSEMKNLAMKIKDNPRDILRNTKTQLPKDTVVFMGNDRNLKAMINRVRSNNSEYGKAPQSLEEIELPLKLKKTINGDEDFLLYDSGKDDSNRFLIYATRSNIEKLNVIDTWFADGTFFIAPDIYQQIFSINVSLNGYNVPLVYICLVSKNESQYDASFKV